ECVALNALPCSRTNESALRATCSTYLYRELFLLGLGLFLPAAGRLLRALGVSILAGLRIEPELVLGILVEPEDFARVLHEDRFLASLFRHLEPGRHQRRHKFLRG